MNRREASIYLVFVVVMTAACGVRLPFAAAQENATVAQKAVDDSRVWDLGRVKEGAVVNHDFIIKNSLNRPMRITNVSSSCGCTVSQVKKRLLASGEETLLAVQFNSAQDEGIVEQFVYVATDDVDNPVMRFIIKAFVIK